MKNLSFCESSKQQNWGGVWGGRVGLGGGGGQGGCERKI